MKLPTNWWLFLLLIPLIQAEPIESDDETTVGYNTSESQSQSPQAEVISSQNEDRPQNTQQEQDPEQTSSLGSGNSGQGNGNAISSAGARVEADVIDVEAANSKAKTGQTTRIYTTGEVDDSFWLKHLGDDFKHAIHLQVGGTNDDYHQLINQTNNGVHEEVHHEYLPGAERPPGYQEQPQQQPQSSGDYGRGNQAAYNTRPRLAAQLSLDSESMALKQHYLQQQQQQRQRLAQYTPHSYTQPTHTQQHQHQHPHQHPHQHQHQHSHAHSHPHQSVYSQNVYSNTNTQNYPLPQRSVASGQVGIPRPTIINSSEDTLHTGGSTSNPGGSSSVASAASSSGSGSGSGSSRSAVNAEGDNDSFGDQMLPFKSPFNDYGSRPTRDLTYLLYRRGL